MKLKYIFTIGAIAALLGSCADQKNALQGEGTVRLNPSISTDVKVSNSSRTDQDVLRSELNESFILWISNSKGLVREYYTLDNVPSELNMVADHYVAEAWAGDSLSASWSDKWYKGLKEFDVKAGEITTVEIPCKIQNVVVSIEYDSSVDEIMTDYSLQASHARGALLWDDEHKDDKGYFMMSSQGNDLTWTLAGTIISSGSIYTTSETIKDAQPGHEYHFKVTAEKNTMTGDDLGGAFITITIDDSEILVDDTVLVTLAPEIKAIQDSFDIDNVQIASPGNLDSHYFYVSAAGELKTVTVTCNQFAKIFGSESAIDFNPLSMSESVRSTLKSAGIVTSYEYDNAAKSSLLTLYFYKDFFDNYFSTEGDYSISIYALDSYGKSTTKDVKFAVSNDPIALNDVDTNLIEFSHNQAPLSVSVANADGISPDSGIYIEYSLATTDNWSTPILISNGTLANGDSFDTLVKGLTPGTTYKYRASTTRTDGSTFYTQQKTFTTEPATQLPNNGFEDWQTSSSPYLIYPSGGEMFWDSGNHGSATMSKNVTVPDSETKHSGNYSISLQSQFVGIGTIGKFAAGNVFIGKYLTTDGTDGILGWGRPFTGRPTALKGYVKYIPGTVNYTNSGAPDIVKGENDKGIIYIALLDSHTENYNGENFPVIIKTKASDQQLFDSLSSHVIAYGELVYDSAIGESGMVEFTIPLTYRNTTVRPSYIMCTASASKGGDYFAGASGSTMWLDDLELIYE